MAHAPKASGRRRQRFWGKWRDYKLLLGSPISSNWRNLVRSQLSSKHTSRTRPDDRRWNPEAIRHGPPNLSVGPRKDHQEGSPSKPDATITVAVSALERRAPPNFSQQPTRGRSLAGG